MLKQQNQEVGGIRCGRILTLHFPWQFTYLTLQTLDNLGCLNETQNWVSKRTNEWTNLFSQCPPEQCFDIARLKSKSLSGVVYCQLVLYNTRTNKQSITHKICRERVSQCVPFFKNISSTRLTNEALKDPFSSHTSKTSNVAEKSERCTDFSDTWIAYLKKSKLKLPLNSSSNYNSSKPTNFLNCNSLKAVTLNALLLKLFRTRN